MADYARSETFRALRAKKRISREEAAHGIGVSTKTIYAWENGGGIKWSNAQAAAEFYGVDPNDLVLSDSTPNGAVPDLVQSIGTRAAADPQLERIEQTLAAGLSDLAKRITRIEKQLPKPTVEEALVAMGREIAALRDVLPPADPGKTGTPPSPETRQEGDPPHQSETGSSS